MVGVVGPNGCGKSNIIDAVRWVLGESRASELRGESMHDVIFNGSDQRAPSARASVELIFDNSQQRLSGQWGTYNELSVRRTLAREEGSRYFINNQQVRRRDIYDIFMGTGLGARGYAIIGQGMINRLIEARPEELRVYLEEAAGVSRYKERRRETENRLRDTRENLERLEDLILEIQQQFKKLKKQAETAQKYQQLKKQKQQMQFALWRLEQNQAFEIQKAKLKEIKTLEVALQGHLTQLSRLQAKGKEQQVRHMQAKKHTQQKQSKLHELNTLVSTTQAELHYVQSNQQRSVQRREQLKQQIAHWQQQNTQFEKQMAQFQEALETAQQQREQAEAKRVNAELQLEDQARTLEKKHQWRDEHRTLLHQHEQQLALLTQRYNDVLSERKQREQRQQELSKQLQKQGNGLALETRIKQYKERVKQKRHELSQWQKDLVVTEEKLPTMQQQAKKKEAQWHDLKQKLIALEERAKTLKEIQQQWASPEDLQIWLNERQWGQVAQLWSYLKVTEGWEPALEAVLGQQLGALIFPQNPLANLDAGALANLSPPKKMNLWFANGANKNQLQSWQGCPPLLQFVQCTDAKVQSLLNLVLQKVWVVKNWQQGFQLAAQLPYGGCLVHPKGHVFNRMGLTLYATHDDQAGMVIRQQELLRLAEKIREKTHAQETAKQLWQEKQKQIEKQQSLLSDKREKTYGLSNELHQIELKIAQSKQTLTQEQERQGYLQQQLDETNQRLQSLGHAKAELEEQLNELESVAETVREAFVQIDEDCISLGQEIESIRQQLRSYEQLDYDCA